MSPARKVPRLWNGRYEPIEVVGRGGEGEVWKGRDTVHDRLVALKVRKAPSKASRESLLAEARVLFSVTTHPLLPVAREDFFEGRKYVLVMDWIEGSDLGRLLAEQGDPGLPVSVVVGWLGQMAESLDHLHTQPDPVVHGDVKPSNAILTPEGRVVLVDFGMSSRSEQAARGGTPTFRAPELAKGGTPTPAADVFGLAATAVALLTGRPFTGTPSWEGIPEATAVALERAIGKALSVDPSRRPSSASQLVERMRSWAATDLPSGTVTYLVSELAEPLPPDDVRAAASILARHDNLVAEVADRHHGRMPVASPALDASVAVFRSAPDAVRAALDLQRRSAEPPVPAGRRVALHTGPAVLRSGTYAGDALRVAVDLARRGAARQVLLTEPTASLACDSLPEGSVLRELGRTVPPPRATPVHTLVHPDLEGATTVLRPGTTAVNGRPRRLLPVVGAAVIAAVLAAGGIAAALFNGGERQAVTPLQFTTSARPILFESTRSGHRQIYAMADPRGDATALSNDPVTALAENSQPTLSPDGTRIVFMSERPAGSYDIYVMNADGTGTRRLTRNPGLDVHPTWSPDGNRIAFVSNRGQGNQIYVMDAELGDSGPVQPLATLPGQSGSPDFSPDGRSIVFHNGDSDGGDIYIADATQANQAPRRLTDDGGNLDPEWSPDGTTLAFVSKRAGGHREVFLMASGGGERIQLTDLRGDVLTPHWSPDGTVLLFASAHEDEAFDLYALPVTARRARQATRLSDTPGRQELNPTW